MHNNDNTKSKLDSFLSCLNREQLCAIESTHPQCCVIAGPGTGKTSVISGRICYLIERMKVEPSKIMALTFSIKAAHEMRERVDMLCPQAKKVRISTFHSACIKILSKASVTFSLVNSSEQNQIIERSIQNIIDLEVAVTSKEILSSISNCKNKDDSKYNGIKDPTIRNIALKYQRELREAGKRDFDDLLLDTMYLLKNNPAFKNKIAKDVEYLLVDEFQDTNYVQYEISKQLCSKYQRIFVVGDPDQNIFQWRAASPKNIDSLKRDFPQALFINLIQNYRSHKSILTTALCLINSDGQIRCLNSNSKSNGKVIIKESLDDSAMVRYIRREILQLVNNSNYKFEDIAILYRCHHHCKALELELKEYDIGILKKGKQRIDYREDGFTKTRDIQSIICHFSLLIDDSNVESLYQCFLFPYSSVSAQVVGDIMTLHHKQDKEVSIVKTIRQYLKQDDVFADFEEKEILDHFCFVLEKLTCSISSNPIESPLELLRSFFQLSKFFDYTTEEERERCQGLLSFLEYEKPSTISEMLAFIEQFSRDGSSEINGRHNKVTLSTLHASKGLEWSVVFIFNLIEGQIPYEKNENQDEEKRLFYVGITRAKQILYLCYSKCMQLDTETAKLHNTSSFLLEIKNRLPANDQNLSNIHFDGLDLKVNRKFLSENLRYVDIIQMINDQKRLDLKLDNDNNDIQHQNTEEKLQYIPLFISASQAPIYIKEECNNESVYLEKLSTLNNKPFKPPRKQESAVEKRKGLVSDIHPVARDEKRAKTNKIGRAHV